MLIYQPEEDTRTRVAWYGGESTQLHYQHKAITDRWIDIETRTLGGGLPNGPKELMHEMREFSNYCS